MSAKKIEKNVEPTLEAFIETWEGVETKEELLEKLSLEGEEGKKIVNRLSAKCRNFGLTLKTLQGAGQRGRQFDTEAFDVATMALSKATGKPVAVIRKEALAKREADRQKAKAKRAEKNSG